MTLRFDALSVQTRSESGIRSVEQHLPDMHCLRHPDLARFELDSPDPDSPDPDRPGWNTVAEDRAEQDKSGTDSLVSVDSASLADSSNADCLPDSLGDSDSRIAVSMACREHDPTAGQVVFERTHGDSCTA